MRTLSTLSLTAIAMLMGLGCAGSMSTMAKPDEGTAAARDTSTTTTARDTSAVDNPSGYRGMERDTTAVPPSDTSGRTAPGMAHQDSTSGMSGMDSTNGMGGMDSTHADTAQGAR